MNAVSDFIRGTAPWAAIGILEVIFTVRIAAKEQKIKKSNKHHNSGGTKS